VTVYRLHVESGPKHRKTMVHVPALLGCIGQGPTTEEALATTPESIRAFLTFVAAHGEAVDPAVAFTTKVEEHVTEGMWLGNGDPSIVFASDLPPLSAKDVTTLTARWLAIREATQQLAAPLATSRLVAKPERGRSVAGMLTHVMGAAPAYLRTFGPVTDLNRAARHADLDPGAARELLAESTDGTIELLEALGPADRKAEHHRGSGLWTARKTLRRLLEHEWEHHRELAARLG